MMPASFLDQPIRLAELCEPESLTELCMGFANLHEIGIKVFDERNHQLVDIQRATGIMTWLFGFPESRKVITQFISELKQLKLEIGEYRCVVDPMVHLRFLVLPITYEFEVLGKLVCGPFVADHLSDFKAPPGLFSTEREQQQFTVLRGAVPRATDEAVRARMALLMKALETICHAGYRALLTSNMHLESITEAYEQLRKANEQLEQNNANLQASNERLRELDQLKSNFLATVSHELRTPLTSVIGYSELLLEGLAGDLNEEQREYISTISERGTSLLQLITSILDISKIERGAQHILCEPVEPRALVEDALDSVRPQAIKGQLNLQVRYEPDLPVIYVDRYKICHSLMNLLGNSIKFTPKGGSISIRVKRATLPEPEGELEAVAFSVRDTGIGIPKAEQGRIFEAFYQVDNTSTRQYDGTGLGLSIVRSFVEAHGGTVSVESEEGQGATFTLTLAVQAQTQP